jgi:hypothetical protein
LLNGETTVGAVLQMVLKVQEQILRQFLAGDVPLQLSPG